MSYYSVISFLGISMRELKTYPNTYTGTFRLALFLTLLKENNPNASQMMNGNVFYPCHGILSLIKTNGTCYKVENIILHESSQLPKVTYYMGACMLSCFSHVWLCVIPWTVVHQAPLPMVFSRLEYCSGLPCPPPGDLPNPGFELASLTSPALAGKFFTTSATWEAHILYNSI